MKPSSRASAPPGEHTPERVGEESSINVRGFGACSLALQVRSRVFQASMGRTAAAGPNPHSLRLIAQNAMAGCVPRLRIPSLTEAKKELDAARPRPSG